jgi:taurine transport system substrate-binding protein
MTVAQGSTASLYRFGRPRGDTVVLGLGCLFAFLTCIVLFHASAMAGPKDNGAGLPTISVGFVRHAYGTWTSRIADGGFNSGTGRTIEWLPYETDSAVAAALASGRVQIGLMGANVVAAVFSRGLDLRIFYVLGASRDTEALLIAGSAPFRAGDAKNLRQRVIAVPFGSTAHFRLLQSLKRWGVAPADVRIVNLQPRQIAAAWQQNEIDAAVVSEPTLSMLRDQSRAIPLPGAGGMEGLMVLATNAEFLKSHDVFLARFVDVISRSDAAFTEHEGPLDETRSEIRAIAQLTGTPERSVIEAIARFRPPSLEDLASPRWLGGGSAAALAAELRAEAELWRWAGRLETLVADYSLAVSPHPVERALAMQR